MGARVPGGAVIDRGSREAAHWIWRVVAALMVGLALAMVWGTGATSIRHLAANLIASYFLVWLLVLCATRKSVVENLARLVLVTSAIGATVAALELPIRAGWVKLGRVGEAVDRARGYQRGEWHGSDFLFTDRPHDRKVGKSRGNIAITWCLPGPEYREDRRFDRNGFRNEADVSSADVVVVGDSFVEGWTVRSDELITADLGRLTSLSVVNLGKAGHGPQQELVTLVTYGLPLKPKFVVWAFYEGNDLEDLLNYPELVRERTAQRGGGRSLIRDSLDVLDRRLERCEPSPDAALRSGTFRRADGGVETIYFWNAGQALTARDERALTLLRGVLAKAHEEATRSGSRMIVLFIPSTYRVYGRIVELPENSTCRDWSINDLPERMQSLVSGVSADIRFLDLTPALELEARSGKLLYLPDDTHWTAAGHATAAGALAEAIRSRPGEGGS